MATHTPYYFEVYRDRERKLRWRFWAPNNRIMADSGQGYVRKQSCIASTNSAARHAAESPSSTIQALTQPEQ